MRLSDILKDSAYKLSQFDGSKIEALEQYYCLGFQIQIH